MNMTRPFALAALAATLPLISGCVGAAIGTAAVTGAAVVQERSAEQGVKDTEIRVAIGSKLLNIDKDDYDEVYIEVVEGRVLLTGKVPSPAHRVKAAETAWSVPGVVELLNELEVGDSEGFVNYARDVVLANRLRARLLAAPGVDEFNYTIEVIDGVVYLLGIAQDEDELTRVVYLMRQTPSVKRVVSHVLTKDDRRRLASS